MLLLVLGDSYVALYVGLGGRGPGVLPAHRLLVHARPAAATAAKKAFIMNRVGDVGLALAIFVMFAQLGTTSYEGVFGGVGALAGGTLTALGLLLLLGACGKSGQFPLQAWLPDAMEGPTPVSALIHAATMVTAGVYLIARSAPIYDLTPTARTVVLAVGAVTLLYGAVVGCAYDDIKKVLAYSTGQPDRLHVPGRGPRPGRLRGGDRAPAHPRLLQGRAVPRRRVGHARDGRPGGHAPLRRAGQEAAGHLRDLRAWATSR
jgi:NADH-quinone oxidoreductase subunit L